MNSHALLPLGPSNPTGLTPRQNRVFNAIASAVIILLIAGWATAIIELQAQMQRSVASPPIPAPVTRTISSAILDSRTETTAFLGEAALELFDPLRGESGKLTAAFRVPGAPLVEENAGEPLRARYTGPNGERVSAELTAPEEPGVYRIALELDRARRAVEGLQIITLVPFTEKKKGRIGLYYLGTWPNEAGGKPRSPSYGNPIGFIEVTPENQSTHVSEHFQLRDFLTKDQPDVWPKYLLLEPKLLDKLELSISQLKKEGYFVSNVSVMSGFRTPRYNHSGGNTKGRANLSRHMYGDAADVFVDNDRNGAMDDLNRDGRVDTKDAEVLARAVERVEYAHPALVGGIARYPSCCGHGPFVHVDVRGYRARWPGSGKGG